MMKRASDLWRFNIFIFALFFVCAFIVFRDSFSTFFVQDDFILISQFSTGTLYQDILKSIGKPEVSHWRPIHNIYFLLSGNLFGKSYYLYHLFSFLIHVSGGLVIYKISKMLFKDKAASVIAGLIYVSNPLHFVSVFWISGNATSIGFLFLATSFYFFLIGRERLCLLLFLLALFASEAMLAGFPIFLMSSFFLKNREPRPKGRGSLIFAQNSLHPRDKSRGFFAQNRLPQPEVLGVLRANIDSHGLKAVVLSSSLQGLLHLRHVCRSFSLGIKLVLISFAFLLLKLFLTPDATFDVYKLELTKNTLFAFKYYTSRVLGFGEASGDILANIILLLFLTSVILLVFKKRKEKGAFLILGFLSLIVAAGFFPFVLIPEHLSGHYMNISAFGFALIIAFAVRNQKEVVKFSIVSLFTVASFVNADNIKRDNWVVSRSVHARSLLDKIRNSDSGFSRIVFLESRDFSSKEAYIVLGQAKALNFWLGKSFESCFDFTAECIVDEKSLVVNSWY